MRQIEIEEVHRRLLNIAQVFDEICTKHNIPYYMLGGTMLGAIRHKGFIPWDDDMDFGVPIERYSELIMLLKQELPAPFRCCTYDEYDSVLSPYVKIDDAETCIDDNCVGLQLEKKIGLNIDVFPLYKCEPNDKHITKTWSLQKQYVKVYVKSTKPTILKSWAKAILRILYPIRRRDMLTKMLTEMNNVKTGSYLANVFGAWGDKEVVPIEYYGTGVRYKFENITLCGLEKYDLYLKKLYGDYMQLPPEDQRHLHGDNVYIR